MFQGITEPREVQYNDKNNDKERERKGETKTVHLICARNYFRLNVKVSRQEFRSVFCSPCPHPEALISDYFMRNSKDLF